MIIRADLHNHSCLSPCGDLWNSPSRMAATAAERGITMMALTDHNSARNCPAFAQACTARGIVPVFGTETTTREEIHILSLFATVEEALDWGSWVYERLPDYHHDQEKYGDQVVVDAEENILAVEERYLIPAIDASLEEIAAETLLRNGLIIPAHIDRTAHSIASQLGFLPDQQFSALEITGLPLAMDTRGHTLICSSDAHFPEEIARRSITFEAPDALDPGDGFSALCAAIRENRITLSISPGPRNR